MTKKYEVTPGRLQKQQLQFCYLNNQPGDNMHNCLNLRRTNTYEISETDEQTDLSQKLQERNTSEHKELTHSPDARGWASLTVEVQELQQIIGELDDRLGDIQSDLEEIVERLK